MNSELNNENLYINEKLARNVWMVQIKHEEIEAKSNEEYLKEQNKVYYVDITTGEIIGGNELNR